MEWDPDEEEWIDHEPEYIYRGGGRTYIYRGRRVHWKAKYVLVDRWSITDIIPPVAFSGHQLVSIEIHGGVKTIGYGAFISCKCLNRVIMKGVKVLEEKAFYNCTALTDIRCDTLAIIGPKAFQNCKSLTAVRFRGCQVVDKWAFANCEALKDAKFGSLLEEIGQGAFNSCESLRSITIPLRQITKKTFHKCYKLDHVNLVEGVPHETSALFSEDWRNAMNSKIDKKIDAINAILPNTPIT